MQAIQFLFWSNLYFSLTDEKHYLNFWLHKQVEWAFLFINIIR